MGSFIDIAAIKSTIEKLLETKDDHEIKAGLEAFLETAADLYKFDNLNTYGIIPDLWSKLFEWLNTKDNPELQLQCLDSLRILTRDNTQYHSLVTKERVGVLLKFANILSSDDAVVDTDYRTVAALKCLFNIIYNSRDGLNFIIDQNCIEKILHRAENSDSKLMSQIKLFDMKVLFLVSAICKDVRDKMKEKHGIKHLIKKLEYVESSTATALTTPEVEVFCEILKILFNLSLALTDDEEDQSSCVDLVQVLRRLLNIPVLNDQMKVQLHTNIVNLLTNMPVKSYSSLIKTKEKKEVIPELYKYDNYNMEAIYHLLEFLQIRLTNSFDKPDELAPILTVLLRIAAADRYIRKYLRQKILPPLRDVHTRPEQGNTLRNRLCRLLTSPITNVSNLAANLLFVLCKENVARMIKHTGYGNAAGLLAQRGLLAGGSTPTVYSSDSESSDTEEYKQYRDGINPVVGCYEPPHPNPVANMSEEQQEYEVMQLVNLMDDLNRKGVVKPCKVGEDGKLQPVEHILELQENLPAQQPRTSRQN